MNQFCLNQQQQQRRKRKRRKLIAVTLLLLHTAVGAPRAREEALDDNPYENISTVSKGIIISYLTT